MSRRKRRLTAFGALLIATAVVASAGGPAAAAPSTAALERPGPDDSERYLVSFHKGANVAEEAQALRSQGVAV